MGEKKPGKNKGHFPAEFEMEPYFYLGGIPEL